jgi:hypothetical protein
MSRREESRARLREGERSKPDDFHRSDPYLRFALRRRLGAARLRALEPVLRRAGMDSAGPISAAATELDRPENVPRLVAWSPAGEPQAEISFHPLHHEVGRMVWRSGILACLGEPGHVTPHTALAHLFGHHGQVPHIRSVACTAGLVKALQRAGADWMRRAWLPRLLERDYDRRWHGTQFLTEAQGGSDVGANACIARPVEGPDGAWRLAGENGFCSNVSADLCVVSARPGGGPAGTAGIGLFVVPRRLEDGRPTGFVIRRLKSKLGTRTLPTREVDFRDALGYPLGRPDEGFKLLMGVVIDTSRLHVAGLWHESWKVPGTDKDGRPTYDKPVTLTRDVAIPPRGEVKPDFELR